MFELTASVLVGAGILLFFLGFALRLMMPNRIAATLESYEAGPRTLAELEMSRPFGERVVIPTLRWLARLIGRFTPERNVEMLRHRLEVAGSPNNWTVVDFMGLQVLIAIAATIIAIPFTLFSSAALLLKLTLVVSAAMLGLYLPLIWLSFRASNRQASIQRSLPDALDLISISVEAGLGLDAALQRVTTKWNHDLSREIARALSEIRVGKVRRDALRDMAARVDVDDLSNVVAAIVQAEQLGVSITKVMRIQSEQMRIKRRQRAQEKAQQAPIKMLLPLGFLIFPSLFIVILGPSVLRLLSGGLIPK